MKFGGKYVTLSPFEESIYRIIGSYNGEYEILSDSYSEPIVKCNGKVIPYKIVHDLSLKINKERSNSGYKSEKPFYYIADVYKEILKNNKGVSMYKNIECFNAVMSKMRDVYISKNSDYGNSFDKSIDEFGIVAAVIRMSDKIERLKSLVKKESKVKDESFIDTVMDLANYAVMTAMYFKKHEDEKKK